MKTAMNSTRITALAVLLAASTAFAQTPPSQTGQKKPPTVAATVPAALKPFQGTWILTSPDGKPLDPSGDLTITITGDKYAQALAGTVNERGTIKLDPAKKPMWIDLSITEGADAGKQQVGVIEIAGGVMKGVFAGAGATTRPTTTAPTAGFISFVGKKKPA